MPSIESIKTIFTTKLGKSTGITVLGGGLSKLILMIATFFCARLLTKSEFGEFSFVRNTLITLLSVCALRFGTLCTKFTVESVYSVASSARLLVLLLFSFFISSLIGVLFVVLPDSVLYLIFDDLSIIVYFRIVGIFLPVFMIQPLIESILRGLMDFKSVAFLQVIMSLFYLVSIYFGASIYGLTGAFIALLTYYICFSIMSIGFLLKHSSYIRNIISVSKYFFYEKNILFTMIIPTFIASFVDAPVYLLCQAIIANHDSMSSVGTLSAVVQLRNTAFIIPTFFFSTYTSFAGRLNATKQFHSYFHQFEKLLLLVSFIGIVISVVLSIFATPLLSLFGVSYIEDTEPLYVANVTIPFYLLFSLINIHMVVRERQQDMLRITILSEFISLVIFVLLVYLTTILPVTSFFISQVILVFVKFMCYFYFLRKDKSMLI